MLREYELMYIVRPELDEEGLQSAVDSIKALVENQGGEVAKTTMWGKRRLAYEVAHLRDGHYVILRLRLDGTKVAAIERALRIHDTVFRHLLVVREPGLNDGPDDVDVEVVDVLGATDDADDAPDAVALADEELTEPEAVLEPVGAGADDDEEE